MTEIQKIKDLFNSSDINNHKLAYILAKNTLDLMDSEIVNIILNDNNGWVIRQHDLCKTKYLFNGDITYNAVNKLYGYDGLSLIFQCLIDGYETSQLTIISNVNYNVSQNPLHHVNEWFSKLDKE